ncbi:3-oxoacyl-(acyl-carrier-protein) reductase FabG [Candidatus Magnetomoraceae bacterium gMMP-15]
MSEKQIAVVTGGSRGIGRAICIRLAQAGMDIYFNYSSADSAAAKETEALAAQAGAKAKGMRVNVSTENEVNTFFKEILKEAGQIDVLVNNAGITKDGLIVRMKEKDWNDVIDINLKGCFFCIKAVAKAMMKQRRGRIVNISSIVGISGNPGQANYVASKAGIIGLTKSIALELASRNITANVVAPGFVATDMTENLSEKNKESLIAGIPLKRMGTPEDISGAVAFLISDEAAYITGQVIHVNGGMYI